MSATQLVLAFVTVVWAAAQYILATEAVRDLLHRPRVRGGNRMIWAIIILCLPIIGPLVYSWNGPTSVRQHDPIATAFDLDETLLSYINDIADDRPSNITPLRPRATGTVSSRSPAQRRGLTRSRAHNLNAGSRPSRRSGA